MQVDIEIEAGRSLASFRTELFLGIYIPLVHAVCNTVVTQIQPEPGVTQGNAAPGGSRAAIYPNGEPRGRRVPLYPTRLNTSSEMTCIQRGEPGEEEPCRSVKEKYMKA